MVTYQPNSGVGDADGGCGMAYLRYYIIRKETDENSRIRVVHAVDSGKKAPFVRLKVSQA